MMYPRTVTVALAMAVIATVTTPRPASADDVFILGEKLYKVCTEEPTFCQGYVAGVADVLFGTEEAILGSRACPKPGTTIGEAASAAVGWMEKNPSRLGFTAYSVVAVALAESFPCE